MRKKPILMLLTALLVVSLCGAYGGAASAEDSYVYSYDFTGAADLTQFVAGIDPAENNDALGYTQDSWVTYAREVSELWKKSDAGLTSDASKLTGDDVTANQVYLGTKSAYTYFEAEATYFAPESNPNGWAGMFFGWSNRERRPEWGDNPGGAAFFLQRDGKPTYSSGMLNASGYTEQDAIAGWQVTGEHTIKLRAVENNIKFWVDGTLYFDLEQGATTAGSLGIYCTNKAITFKSFRFSPLNAQGEVEQPKSDYLKDYDFTGAPDLSQLRAGIDPAAESADLGYDQESWVTYQREVSELWIPGSTGLTADASKLSGNDVTANQVYLGTRETYRYFEAEATYVHPQIEPNGWAGMFFGWTEYARRPEFGDNPGGYQFFVQRDGNPTWKSVSTAGDKFNEAGKIDGWDWSAVHTIKLRVIENNIKFWVDGTLYFDLAQGGTADGSIGIYCTNKAITFKSFRFSPLNAQGEVYQPVTGLTATAPASANVMAPVAVNVEVQPASATVKTVGYRLPAGAYASGNTLTFARAGTYEITAYSVDNSAITSTFTVEAKAVEGYRNYSLTAEGMSKFANYYLPDGNSGSGAEQPWSDYWTANADGSLSLKPTDANTNGVVDAGYSFLYLKDVFGGAPVKTNCFELTYAVSTDNAANGWHGVAFAKLDKSKAGNQQGVTAFLQEQARKATVWGAGTGCGGLEGVVAENSCEYVRNQKNLIKVRVFGSGEAFTLQMYVNDMQQPAVELSSKSAFAAGEIAIFASTVVQLYDVTFAQLDANGNVIDVIYPETVTVNNPIAQAKVGDANYQLSVTVAPDYATDKGVIYSSSQKVVASVNSKGVIMFLTPGTVTITVTSVSNPSVSASFELTVTADDDGTPDLKPMPDVPDDVPEPNDCGAAALGGSLPAAALLLGLAIFACARISRKEGKE